VDWVDADVHQVRRKLASGHHLGHSLVTWQRKFKGQNKNMQDIKNMQDLKSVLALNVHFQRLTVTIIILQEYKTLLLLVIFTKS
jgi:hypothetical protein